MIETNNSSVGLKIFIIAVLLVIGFFLVQIIIQLNKNTENQLILQSELQKLSNINLASNKPIEKRIYNQTDNYLSDLVWVFNQHAQLDPNQSKLDIKPLLGLQDLLNRVTASGFKGNALVTISVGNFCNTVNELGEAQLAKPEININNCIFSNEIYSMEKLIGEYSYQAHLIVNNIMPNDQGHLTIIINAQEGKEPYPEKTLPITAQEWNRIAALNNRVDLVLLPE